MRARSTLPVRRRLPSGSAALALAWALAAGGCADEGPVAVVRLQARPAVGTITEIEVAFDNDNATQRETFAVSGRSFPLTFSVQTPGRAGTLAIHADAKNGTGEVRAVGDATVELDPDGRVDTDLMLEPNDFVVNTTFVGTQDLAFRFDGGGRQIAAGPDGRFTIGWSDTCEMVGRCDVFGRRFDPTGAAVTTALAAGDAQFNFNRTDGQTGYEPSLATDRSGNTLAVWSTGLELFAVVVDAAGSALTAVETPVTTMTSPSTPAVVALPDGRFVVAWADTGPTGQQVILARYLSAAGQPVNNPVTNNTLPFQVSTTAMTSASPPAMVALGNGSAIALAWVDGSIVRGRFYGTTGLPSGTDRIFASHVVADAIQPPQLGTIGGDAVILYPRFTNGGDADNGQLILRRISTQGVHVGNDAIVTDDCQFSPAGLTILDGEVGVAWSGCLTRTDGAGCGVWFRHYGVDLVPRTEPIAVNSTTTGDQEDPSVVWLPGGAVAVAWSDGSQGAPDRDGGSVRARIIYPSSMQP